MLSVMILVTIAVLLEPVLGQAADKSYILVGRSQDSTKIRVNITTCSNLPQDHIGDVTSINTRDLCARFFDNWNCTGESIEIMPRSPSHADLTPWGFNDRTVSIGPCRDRCDWTVTGKVPKDPFYIEIFAGKNYKTTSDTPLPLTLEVNGCTSVPIDFQNEVSSIRTYRNCIQLWSNPACVVRKNSTDDTVEVRWGTPKHSDLRDAWWMRRVAAVSHCRYKCKDSDSGASTKPVQANDVSSMAAANTMDNTHTSGGCSAWVYVFITLLGVAAVGLGYLAFLRYREGKQVIVVPRWRSEEQMI